MAKYIPGRNYIGSSEIATDLDVTGPTTFSNTLTVGEDDTGYDVKFYGATSGRYLLWDESDDALELTDNTKIKLGDGSDFQFYHSGTNSFITNTVGDINIINHTDNGDIKFQGDDQSGGDAVYFRLDGGTGYVKFEDNRRIAVGSGNDFMIYHDGTDTKFSNVTGTLQFHQNVNDSDIIFFCDDGSGGVTAYITLDGSATNIKVAKDMRFYDNVEAEFGTNGDFKIYHDGSNTYLEQINAGAGNIVISNANDDADVILQSDDGSGGVTPYLTLDGGLGFTQAQKKIRFIDNIPAEFGSQGDFTINHNGSHLTMNNSVGNITIRNYTDDGDIIFQSDDGSGGTETYFYLDGSIGLTTFPDNKKLAFGSGNDLQIKHNGTDGFITNVLGNLNISTSSDNSDIIFSSDDGSGGTTAYLTLDGGLSVTKFSKNTVHSNGVNAYFGSSSVASISHNGSDFTINNTTGNFTIKNSADNSDIIFQSDDGSGGTTTYFFLDGSATQTKFNKDTRHIDNIKVLVGSAGDAAFWHDGTRSRLDNYTGSLEITNYADDSDIVFYCDNGSGGTEEYFRLDGSANTAGNPVTLFPDNSLLGFGTGFGDLQLHHDGSDSYIKNRSVGDLIIQQDVDDRDLILKCDNGSGGVTPYITLDGSDLSTRILTQKLIISNLPTSDPGVSGQVWNNNGVLNISAGG